MTQPATALVGLHAWPTDFPDAAWPMILDALRGKLPDDPIEAWHVVWHCIGYLSAKYDPHHPPFPRAGDALQLSREEAANILEERFVKKSKGMAGDEALPWIGIIAALLELAIFIFRRRQNAIGDTCGGCGHTHHLPSPCGFAGCQCGHYGRSPS